MKSCRSCRPGTPSCAAVRATGGRGGWGAPLGACTHTHVAAKDVAAEDALPLSITAAVLAADALAGGARGGGRLFGLHAHLGHELAERDHDLAPTRPAAAVLLLQRLVRSRRLALVGEHGEHAAGVWSGGEQLLRSEAVEEAGELRVAEAKRRAPAAEVQSACGGRRVGRALEAQLAQRWWRLWIILLLLVALLL